MTNSGGMTKAECRALVAIRNQAGFGAHISVGIWLLELHWSLMVGIWDFRNLRWRIKRLLRLIKQWRVNLTA
jgi:hypothetical protein